MRRLFMALITALATTVAALAVAATTPCFAQALQPDALRKLHDLGYPSDTTIAIQRWRADNGRRETGPLGAEETAALIAQPLPEFFAAMVGNPFTGMGLALRHKTRAEAEQEALKLCRAQGGGATCANPQVVRADQCVAAVGYSVTIDRRPTYRTSVAVSGDAKLSMSSAMEACQTGATHPAMCRSLLSFCGDGRELQVLDGNEIADGGDRSVR